MNVAIFKAKIRKLEPKDWISVTTTIILSLKKKKKNSCIVENVCFLAVGIMKVIC